MGSWNTKPFGNDVAMDWACELDKQECKTFLTNSLSQVINAIPDVDELEEALAAAKTVLSASHEPVTDCPKEIKDWIKYLPYTPDSGDIKLAINALDVVLDDSELKGLWSESSKTTFNKWLSNTQKLKEELLQVDPKEVPKRKIIKRPLPRTLDKLAILARDKKDAKAVTKIMSLLKDIDDLDVPIKQVRPLCMMSEYGVFEAVKYILDNGALNAFDYSLLLACENNHYEIAELLVINGATVVSSFYRDPVNGRSLKNDEVNESSQHYHFSAPLFKAVQSSSVALVDLLLANGANLNMVGRADDTLLHMACKGGNLNMVKYLISCKAEVNAVDSSDETPLCKVNVSNNNIDIAIEIYKFLIEYGIDLNVRNHLGLTLLYRLENMNDEFVKPLIFILKENSAVTAGYWTNEEQNKLPKKIRCW